jgi:hypothetical protein
MADRVSPDAMCTTAPEFGTLRASWTFCLSVDGRSALTAGAHGRCSRRQTPHHVDLCAMMFPMVQTCPALPTVGVVRQSFSDARDAADPDAGRPLQRTPVTQREPRRAPLPVPRLRYGAVTHLKGCLR